MAVETTGFCSSQAKATCGFGSELPAKRLVGLELVAVRLDPAPLALVCNAPRTGGCQRAGEQTEVQRTVCEEPDPEGAQRGHGVGVVTPTWVRLNDFQRTAPRAIERLVQAKQG
jgi:hypothetical protein